MKVFCHEIIGRRGIDLVDLPIYTHSFPKVEVIRRVLPVQPGFPFPPQPNTLSRPETANTLLCSLGNIL